MTSSDVTIPADVAREEAAQRARLLARQFDDTDPVAARVLREAADLLDPRPASLREQVIAAVAAVTVEWCGTGDTSDDGEPAWIAGAVLAVVADWLTAQPLRDFAAYGSIAAAQVQRDHDVRLIREAS